MKVAFCLESVLTRNHYTELAEAFIQPFDRAAVHTFAHHPGKTGGNLEYRPINSSYLSSMVRDEKGLRKRIYLLPHIASTFDLDCQTQLMVSLSGGFAHGMAKPSHAVHLCYLYDWPTHFEGWLNRVMAPATRRWMERSLAGVDALWVSREELLGRVSPHFHGSPRVLPPEQRAWGDALKDFIATV